jgi:hypothetical protein
MKALEMRSLVIATSAMALASLLGCASIIGADDYKVGGDGGPTGGSTGTGGNSGTGGGPGTGGGTGGDPGTGGSVAGTGESLCGNQPDCAPGLACEHSSLGASGICVSRCQYVEDCDSNHDCVGGTSVGFESSCILKCPEGTCPDGFTCANVPAADDASAPLSDCLPSDWLGSDDGGITPEDAPSGKGTGDGCILDSECASGVCASNQVDPGWCTKICTSTLDCVGSHAGHSEFGAVGGCFLAANNNYQCFPECDSDPNLCGYFPGTICAPGFTDIGGVSHALCTLPPSEAGPPGQ